MELLVYGTAFIVAFLITVNWCPIKALVRYGWRRLWGGL